jgi:hypothetical protein
MTIAVPVVILLIATWHRIAQHDICIVFHSRPFDVSLARAVVLRQKR